MTNFFLQRIFGCSLNLESILFFNHLFGQKHTYFYNIIKRKEVWNPSSFKYIIKYVMAS